MSCMSDQVSLGSRGQQPCRCKPRAGVAESSHAASRQSVHRKPYTLFQLCAPEDNRAVLTSYDQYAHQTPICGFVAFPSLPFHFLRQRPAEQFSTPGAFVFLILVAAWLGLSTFHLPEVNDKVLHFVTFFLITTCFYWIIDTSRRRNLHFTLIVCTGFLGIGSELLQGVVPNERIFDVYDIVANIVGSLTALALSAWYHKRMIDRKRAARGYGAVPGADPELDVELGASVGDGAAHVAALDEQESGIVPAHVAPATTPTLEAELDNWDENEPDAWDDDDPVTSGDGEALKTPSANSGGDEVVPAGERNIRAD